MKKTIALLLAMAIVIASFAGCSNSTPTSSGGSSTPASNSTGGGNGNGSGGSMEGREVNLVGSVRTYPGMDADWDTAVAQFKEETGITVNLRWQGQWNEIAQNMTAAKLANEKVDIFTAGAGLVNSTLARSGAIKDVTQLFEPLKGRFVDGMLDYYTVGDHLWGIPYGGASSCAVFYNKTIYDELGLSVPKTFDEFAANAKVITEKKPGIMPMVHQGKASWWWPAWFFETYAQTSGNKSVQNVIDFLQDKRTMSGPEEIAAFQAINDFFTAGILTSDSLETDQDGMYAAFAQQKAVHIFGATTIYAAVDPLINGSFEFGIFDFPLITDDPNVTPQHGGGPDDALVIPQFADDNNLDATMSFFEFLLRPETANLILEKAKFLIPAITSMDSADTPITDQLNDQFLPETIKYLDWIWPVEVNDVFVQDIPAVLIGSITPEEAAQDIDKALATVKEEKDFQYDWWTLWTDDDWAKVTPTVIPEINVK